MIDRMFSTAIFILFTAAVILSSCEHSAKDISPTDNFGMLYGEPFENSQAATQAPYVILISIDGYRSDYTEKYKPPHLSQLQKRGVSSNGLVPVFPSKTFPNHYSIATGLYANHHGLVSNGFYEPSTNKTYALSDRAAVEDASWYKGVPLWNLARSQNMVSASYFWVGPEAPIGRHHPNYYFRYNQKVSNTERVNQVIEWLKYPEKNDPT